VGLAADTIQDSLIFALPDSGYRLDTLGGNP